MNVALDASNLLDGGGRTHLMELVQAIDPSRDGEIALHVFGNTSTLDKLVHRPWLHRHALDQVGTGQLARWWWRRTAFPRAVRDLHIDVVFAPGGLVGAVPCPCVTMSRNMLPFEPTERARYGNSAIGVRLQLLHWLQRRAFQRADGVIFLSEYARRTVLASTGALSGAVTVIPHGVAARFRDVQLRPPRPAADRPFRWLYVSIIDLYKHQHHVATAVLDLTALGCPMELELVGRAYAPALAALQQVLRTRDPAGAAVRYLGELPYAELHQRYAAADGFVFASTCENLPNILREALASGIPCAVADAGVMPEVAGDAAVYFNAEDPADIARALRTIASDAALRASLATRAIARSREWTWERCAADTIAFLRQVSATPTASPASPPARSGSTPA
jgi:glycosyltransferase involved in cell wall biosynthesis